MYRAGVWGFQKKPMSAPVLLPKTSPRSAGVYARHSARHRDSPFRVKETKLVLWKREWCAQTMPLAEQNLFWNQICPAPNSAHFPLHQAASFTEIRCLCEWRLGCRSLPSQPLFTPITCRLTLLQTAQWIKQDPEQMPPPHIRAQLYSLQSPGSEPCPPLSLVIPGQPLLGIQKNITENSTHTNCFYMDLRLMRLLPSSWTCLKFYKHLNAYENEIIQMSLQMLWMASQYSLNAKKISSPHMGVSVCKWDQGKQWPNAHTFLMKVTFPYPHG